jgi:hypothetical protein
MYTALLRRRIGRFTRIGSIGSQVGCLRSHTDRVTGYTDPLDILRGCLGTGLAAS